MLNPTARTSATTEGKWETRRKDISWTCLEQSCPLIVTQRPTMLNYKISLFPCLDRSKYSATVFPLKLNALLLLWDVSAPTCCWSRPQTPASTLFLLPVPSPWFSKFWKKKKGKSVITCRGKKTQPPANPKYPTLPYIKLPFFLK